MATSKQLQEAWRFFQRHAGYRVPPGPAACALALARAELLGRRVGLLFRWEADEDAWWDFMDGDEIRPGTVEVCVCLNGEEVLGCVGAICDADDDYRRVVEAELAQEALARFDKCELDEMTA